MVAASGESGRQSLTRTSPGSTSSHAVKEARHLVARAGDVVMFGLGDGR